MNQITTLLLLLLLVATSNQKEEGFPRSQATLSTAKQAALPDWQQGIKLSKEEKALVTINRTFNQDFESIRLHQVEGVTMRKFGNWLEKSNIGKTKEYLQSVFDTARIECLLIHQVKYRRTNEKVTVGLIGLKLREVAHSGGNAFHQTGDVPNEYKVITIVERPRLLKPSKVCTWNQCSQTDGECITWQVRFPVGTISPISECFKDKKCESSHPHQSPRQRHWEEPPAIATAIATF